jgi:hypothetical protein
MCQMIAGSGIALVLTDGAHACGLRVTADDENPLADDINIQDITHYIN